MDYAQHNLIDYISHELKCSFADETKRTLLEPNAYTVGFHIIFRLYLCIIIITYIFLHSTSIRFYNITYIYDVEHGTRKKNALKKKLRRRHFLGSSRAAAFCTRVRYKRIPWRARFPARLRQSI